MKAREQVSRMPIILKIVEDFMVIIDHLEDHLNLFHRILNQIYGGELKQIIHEIDQMLDHNLLEEGDFNKTREI